MVGWQARRQQGECWWGRDGWYWGRVCAIQAILALGWLVASMDGHVDSSGSSCSDGGLTVVSSSYLSFSFTQHFQPSTAHPTCSASTPECFLCHVEAQWGVRSESSLHQQCQLTKFEIHDCRCRESSDWVLWHQSCQLWFLWCALVGQHPVSLQLCIGLLTVEIRGKYGSAWRK